MGRGGSQSIRSLKESLGKTEMVWSCHEKREDEFVCKRVMNMEVGGRRRKGRPKFRWKDNIAKDLKEKVLSEQDTQDRIRWRRLTSKGDPI